MDIQKFAKSKKSCYAAEEGFLFWRIDNPNELPADLFSEQENLNVHLLIEEGTLTVKSGDETHHGQKHQFASFIDRNNFSLLTASQPLKAYCMLFTNKYIQSLLLHNPPLPFSYILHIRKQPIDTLSPEHFTRLRNSMEYLGRAAADQAHPLREKMIRCAVWMFLLDIAAWHGKSLDHPLSNTRRDNIFQTFMHLLAAHIAREHTVSFYASTLCVTPQYLNRIVRTLTGRTVSNWIDFTLTCEITKLLDNSNLTIQTIARQLGFPDQATLSKFYKRHTSLTPSQRRQHE